MKVSVGIIGAGPSGLMAAILLVRAGIECAVFERLSEEGVRARTRAGLIEARTAAVLERHGLAQGMLSRGSTSRACEFRRSGTRYLFEYGNLSGVVHHVYPQQLLVADLIDALRSAGGEVMFERPVRQVSEDQSPTLRLEDGTSVQCDIVLGCDGFHGVSRAAIKGASCSGVDFGAEWLVLLAEAPPSSDHTVYALHPDGFAGHMLRSRAVSRFYLQVPPGSHAQTWSDDRTWEHLHRRLAAEGVDLAQGRIIERSILQLHSFVTEPMQQGRIYLAGDAAHIVTPAGGKGMNIALQDTDELVAGLLDHFHRRDDSRIDAYSVTRLPSVWRAVDFSHWFLENLLLARPAEGRFREGLREARLARLMESKAFALDFAANYVGLPEAA